MKAATKEYIKALVVIVGLCLVMGIALASVHAITQPRIEANDERKLSEAVTAMFGASVTKETVDKTDAMPSSLTALYRIKEGDETVGYVAYLVTKSGYGTSTFVLGVNAADGTVADLSPISYGDSIDCGDAYYGEIKGKAKDDVDLVASASPARYTRTAIRNAVSEILAYLRDNHYLKGDRS